MKKTFFTKKVDTYRLTAVTDTDNEVWVVNLVDHLCNIQPLDSDFNEDMEGSYGKDFLMFCDDSNIVIGDKIIDNTVEYIVKGIREYELMGFGVMEITIRLTK